MAKKRKIVKPVGEIIETEDVSESSPPLCFGSREDFCRPDLCGKWFESCNSEN